MIHANVLASVFVVFVRSMIISLLRCKKKPTQRSSMSQKRAFENRGYFNDKHDLLADVFSTVQESRYEQTMFDMTGTSCPLLLLPLPNVIRVMRTKG